jgi:hypothetical protein
MKKEGLLKVGIRGGEDVSRKSRIYSSLLRIYVYIF